MGNCTWRQAEYGGMGRADAVALPPLLPHYLVKGSHRVLYGFLQLIPPSGLSTYCSPFSVKL